MKTHLLRLVNFKGHQNLELRFNAITALIGGNGTGKTTVIDAFRSLATGGSEPEAIRTGEEEAEIKWVLELFPADVKDTELLPGMYDVTRTIRHDGYSLSVKNPKKAKVPKEKAFVEKYLPKMAYDPISFDKLTDEERAEKLKKILAVPVTTAEIRKSAGLVQLGPIAEESFPDGVSAIEKFDGVLEAQAKELRAAGKALEGSIKTFEASIEGKSVDDVAAEQTREREFLAGEEKRLAENVAGIRAVYEAQITEIDKVAKEDHRAHADWHAEETRKLAEQLAEKRRATDLHTVSERQGAMDAASATTVATVDPIRESVAMSKSRLQGLEARAEEAQKLIGAMEQVEKWRKEQATKAEDLERIGVARDQLDRLRLKLLAKLPLDGMSIKKGRLFIGDILSSEVNTAARLMKWIEIAGQYANEGQLIVTDDLEHLTDENKRIVEEAIKSAGMQLLATIVPVKDAPLRVVDTLVEG